ncbi:MAG: 2-oxoglutarate and iron-dependent oxygenase domain-containing protein [Actinomycetota bacterium]|nr:2-oxoglutarate and iron-dependent oxygenase domain-containing protein [Actinomycetota bacterium]
MDPSTAPEIPVIDISGFLAGTDRAAVAAAVADACRTVGFLQIVGHGIETEALDAAYAAMASLVELPEPDKDAHQCPNGHPFRGYSRHTHPDGRVAQERFQINRFDDAAAAAAAGVPARYGDYFVANVWPDLDGFEPALRSLFARTQLLGARIMELFEQALGVAPGSLVRSVEPNVSCLAVNHYPASGVVGTPDAEPVILLREHPDSGTLTILHQRGTYEGLQILDPGGEWRPVPVREDAFVVNIGELMARWTNNRWRSTRHRVVGSPDPADHRTTITTFHLPAVDTTVAPLAELVGDATPAYEAVTPYEWERMFLETVSATYERTRAPA